MTFYVGHLKFITKTRSKKKLFKDHLTYFVFEAPQNQDLKALVKNQLNFQRVKEELVKFKSQLEDTLPVEEHRTTNKTYILLSTILVEYIRNTNKHCLS